MQFFWPLSVKFIINKKLMLNIGTTLGGTTLIHKKLIQQDRVLIQIFGGVVKSIPLTSLLMEKTVDLEKVFLLKNTEGGKP